ncbi:hypothetical protein FHR24_000873 [Wenyingzhuangia heitensis]|uniref:Uncharacterized protein n=1 Tax=Wenyingzhuangia heitensis TaxID=1487859 RepID=A0ABX0U6G6_9FLAO|nr:hypothetical protein [Wenyingzhuangia heitensis]NIJ44434.1 hypothetical protein [Wenyingzhuangia heitensis]
MVKNFNTGKIFSLLGDIHIGDNSKNLITQSLQKQIKTIEDLLNQYKVKTSLELLNDLEKSTKSIAESPEKNSILSKVYYLKGFCKHSIHQYQFTEGCKDFIKAYNYDNKELCVKENASIHYYNLENEEKSIDISNDILKIDEYNLTANFVKFIYSDDKQKYLKLLPPVVFNDYVYQVSVVYYLIIKRLVCFKSDIYKYFPGFKISTKQLKGINFYNKSVWFINTEITLNFFFKENPIKLKDYNFHNKDNYEFKELTSQLDEIHNEFDKTELSDEILNFKFFKYYLNSDINYNKFNSVYKKLRDIDFIYTKFFCSYLTTINKPEKIRSVLLKYNREKNYEFYLFEIYMFYINNFDDFLDKILLQKLFDSFEIVDSEKGIDVVSYIFPVINHVFKERYDDYKIIFLGKVFNDKHEKKILEVFLEVFFENKSIQHVDDVTDLLKDDMLKKIYKLKLLDGLRHSGFLEIVYEELKQEVYLKEISPELELYIITINDLINENEDLSKDYVSELLPLLSKWRKSYTYLNRTIFNIEFELLNSKNDWDELLDVTESLYKILPKDVNVLSNYLLALDKTNDLTTLKKVLSKFSFKINNEAIGLNIIILCLKRKFFIDKALRLVYVLASNEDNIDARKFYFHSSNLFPEGFFKNYEKVFKGTFILYEYDDRDLHLLKINNYNRKIIGKKIGDSIKMDSYTDAKKEIKIKKIINSELALFHEIQLESSKPYNNLGMESIEIENNDIVQTLIDKFGKVGSKRQEEIEGILEKYKKWNVGLSEISVSVFNNDIVEAYEDLKKDEELGMFVFPDTLYPKINVDQSYKYILDFSSVLLFEDLYENYGVVYKETFLVSYYVIECLKELLYDIETKPKSFLIANITEKGIRNTQLPEDYYENKLIKIKGILSWIDTNCTIDYVQEKLNIKKDVSKGLAIIYKLFFDNIFMSIRDKHIVVSSDSFYFRNNVSVNIINPLSFIKNNNYYDDFDHYLIKNNHIGVVISKKCFLNELKNSIEGNQNYLNNCLKNISFFYGLEIIDNLIEYFKLIMESKNLDTEEKKGYCFKILKHLYSEVNIETSEKINFFLLMKLKEEGFKEIDFFKTITANLSKWYSVQ